jgi:hypothetical protein
LPDYYFIPNVTWDRKAGNYNSILAPQSRVLLEKLTVPQLVKKFSEFYGTKNSLPH